MRSTLHNRMNRGFRTLVPVVVEPGPVGEEGDVLWEVECHGDYDHTEEEEEEGV